MATLKPRYTIEEHARKGQEIYERAIRPQLKPEDEGEFVAIDVDTAWFEVDEDDYTATERLLARNREAQIWLVRFGEPTAYRQMSFSPA